MMPRCGWPRRSSSSSSSTRSATGVSTPAVTRGGPVCSVRHGGLGLAALSLAAGPGVGDLVPADAHEPGRQRALVRPVARAAGPGRDEGLLGDVLGVGTGPEGAHGHPVDLAGPALVGQGQRLLVARREAAADLDVVGLRSAARAPELRSTIATLPKLAGRPGRARGSPERLGDDDDVVAVAAELAAGTARRR